MPYCTGWASSPARRTVRAGQEPLHSERGMRDNPGIRLALSADAAGEGLAAFDPQLNRLGLHLRSEITIGRCKPPAEMTTLLRARGDVIFRRRAVSARSGPVCLSTSYLIDGRADDIWFSWPEVEPGGRYACLAAAGRPLMVARAVAERDPDQQEAAFLCPGGQRVHACTQVTYLPRRETLQTCVHAFPADRWDLLTFWNDAFPR